VQDHDPHAQMLRYYYHDPHAQMLVIIDIDSFLRRPMYQSIPQKRLTVTLERLHHSLQESISSLSNTSPNLTYPLKTANAFLPFSNLLP